MAYAFGAALFAGLVAILTKVGVRNTDSNIATAVCTLIVLIVAWIMVLEVGSLSTLTSISAYTLLFLILSGLATGASWVCYFRALQMGAVNQVVPIDKISTVLTVLLAIVVFGETQQLALKLIGVAGIAGGTWLIIPKTAACQSTSTKGWLKYALLAALFASLTALLGKVGIEGVESNLGTAIRTVVVLILAWLMVLVTGKQKQVRDISCRDMVFLCLSGLATGGSWLCYYKALQTGPASVVVPIDKLSIVLTIIFSRVVLGEPLSLHTCFGLVILVAGTLVMLIP